MIVGAIMCQRNLSVHKITGLLISPLSHIGSSESRYEYQRNVDDRRLNDYNVQCIP